jgi:hypothetical protein
MIVGSEDRRAEQSGDPLKPRERFVTARRCGVPDRVPVHDFIGGRGLQQQLLGYATNHSLHDDIPLENIHAYVEVAHKYGAYPLNLPR